MRTLLFHTYRSCIIKSVTFTALYRERCDILTFTVSFTESNGWRPAVTENPKDGALMPAWHLIGPPYSTSTIFVRQTGFALHQTVYWFNKLSIDSKRLGMFYSPSLSVSCSLSLSLRLTFKFSILFVMADKALKGWSFLDSGLLSRWQSALAFPLYADIGPLCH